MREHEYQPEGRSTRRGEGLHEFIMRAGLTILNRESELTFMDCRRQEVIDIIVCTEGMTSLMGDWRVSDESLGSDYRQIRYVLKHTDWESYRTEGLESIQDSQ